MKALSLWEPWATLMREQFKCIETRGWYTSHRGPLLICASKKRDDGGRFLWEVEQEDGCIPEMFGPFDKLPFGHALCVVNLVACVKTEWLLTSHEDKASRLRTDYFGGSKPEERYGNYSDGRFAWITEFVRRFDPPFPLRGAQGLFEVDDALIRGDVTAPAPPVVGPAQGRLL